MKILLRTIAVIAGLMFILINAQYYALVQDPEFVATSKLIEQRNKEAEILAAEVKFLSNSVKSETDQLNEIEGEKQKLIEQADQVSLKQAGLKGEADAGLSLGVFLGKLSRATFDAMSGGIFAEEGVMTESKKFERWVTQLVVSDAVNTEKVRQIQRDYNQLLAKQQQLSAKILPIAQKLEPLLAQIDSMQLEHEKDRAKVTPKVMQIQSLEKKREKALIVAAIAIVASRFVKKRKDPSIPVPPKAQGQVS